MSTPGDRALPAWRSFAELPRAHGEPVIRCVLRAQPEDFVVDEELAFGPDGEGEHCLLRVRKSDANTDWAARRLAALCNVPVKAVGYAGMKDRRAVTTQWFSVHLGPRPIPNWGPLVGDGIEVLECHRHRRKLRRGMLAANQFVLRLREVDGDPDALSRRVDLVARVGVPNYFGPQRFGRDEGNLIRADALFRGFQAAGSLPGTRPNRRRATHPNRHLMGLWLSAARSQLFNEVLALRVARRDWQTALAGERLQLLGSHSHFLAEQVDDELRARVDSGDVQPTGPLFGGGEPLTAAEVAALEAGVAAAFPHWIEGLAAADLRQERRALGVLPDHLIMAHPEPDQVILRFSLPAGSYATAVLRELAVWDL